jgi:hypothetical protein
VRWDYGGRVFEFGSTGPETLPVDPATTGSWLVLVRPAAGGPVVSACGGPLPAGDVAAG